MQQNDQITQSQHLHGVMAVHVPLPAAGERPRWAQEAHAGRQCVVHSVPVVWEPSGETERLLDWRGKNRSNWFIDYCK